MTDDAPTGRPGRAPLPSDGRDRGKVAPETGTRPDTPGGDAPTGPRLVGPEDEERRGGVPGLEKDD